MTKIKKYIQNSDFPTLANDSSSVTVSVTIPNGSSAQQTATVDVGEAGAPIIYSIKDSSSGFEWACAYLQYIDSVGESVIVNVRRVSATQVQLTARPTFGAITGAVTFTARIRSFVPPVV